MFRSSRWRSEKQKVKAVFKLQFHVTQVLQTGVDALVLSIIPEDVGKPTTKLEKTTVRDGICRWEKPVYETVKFIQEPKIGKIYDKIYHFVVSTGLAKTNSIIGEVSINFADYAEATKPSTVSFPIKNSHCDSVLHVSIQRLQENGDKREEEECEEVKTKSRDRSLRTYLSNGDTDETESNSAEDVSAKAITLRAEFSTDCRTSSGSDITLSSSAGTSSGLDTPKDLGLRNTNIHQEPHGLVSCMNLTSEPQKPSGNSSSSVHDEPLRLTWDWSAGSDHGLSTDDSSNGSHDALLKERPQQASDMEIERLKTQLAALARQVDVSDLELQTLRKQIVKESKRGQELSKEVISLKEERDALQTECDNLKSFYKRVDEAKLKNRSQLETGDLYTLVEEIRQELDYQKALNANLQLQLTKTQESNAELVLAVQDLDGMVEQKNKEMYNLYNNYKLSKNSQELRGSLSKCETDDDEEQKVLEEIVKEHSNAKDPHLLEQKIIDLCSEIEIYRRDKDELEMQMEQLALDYEILKQENHDIAYKLEQSQLQDQLKLQYECSSPPPPAVNELENHIENLEIELKKQSEDFSDSLATIKELESHIRRLEEDLEKQAQSFEADLKAVTLDKVEQEQRAIRAEEVTRELESHIRRLEEELEKQAQSFEADLKAMTQDKVEQEQRAIQVEEANKELESHVRMMEEELEKQAQSFEADLKAVTQDKVEQEQRAIQVEEATKELESHIRRMEEEFVKQGQSFEADLRAVTHDKVEQEQRAIQAEEATKELESHIRRMEEELEKQAQSFEADLKALTLDKVKQEKRAIRAEEALRTTRIKHANAAERLQEEFRRLSMQMASTFDANEKAAMRAVTEASELRSQKSVLEQLLQNVKEELHSVKMDYEGKLNELSNQVDTMTVQIQQMFLEIEDKSKQLENQKKHEEQVSKNILEEIRVLKAEKESLKLEISCLYEQLEQKEVFRTDLELVKKSCEESETLLQKGTDERNQLVKTIALLRKEAEQSFDELTRMRHLKDEKETMAGHLKSELEALRAQYSDLKHSLFEDEAEKEKFRKQIFQLRGDLKKKEDALTNIEKKFKDSNGRTQLSDGNKIISKNKRSASIPQKSTEMESLRDKTTMLEGLIKIRENSLETSTTLFLEKEKELQDKIEELEKRVEEFNQSSALLKVVKDESTLNDEYGGVSTDEHLNGKSCCSAERMVGLSSVQSDLKLSEEQVRTFMIEENGGGNLCDLLTELQLSKERNEAMESELKEMQEKYLEMSLKFAEVEGERQKLVMTVRNLKVAQKG